MHQVFHQDQMVLDSHPLFVVGTGRCGSTLISNMLREHPSVLSLSELFAFVTDLGSLIPQAFPEGYIDANQFWSIVGGMYHKQNLMIRYGVEMAEALYPFHPTSRFTRETGVPALLQTTLPHLTSDHDALFDEVQEFVLSLPPAPIQQQYLHLFEWLRLRFGRQLWVERSGGSLRIVHRFCQLFPNARFIHIVRDGRDCAISMSRHYGFRMVLLAFQLTEILNGDPFESSDRSGVEDLSDELFPFLPEHFDADAFRRYETSPSLCGHYWSGEIIAGLRILAQLPSHRLLTMHYEEFLADPIAAVRKLITFIDPALIDEMWIHQAASLVRSANSSWKTLPLREQKLLEAACRPGFEALRSFLEKSTRE